MSRSGRCTASPTPGWTTRSGSAPCSNPSYVYDNYYDKYDWFHFGGDDYYLLVENLRLYLESEEIQLASNGGMKLPLGKEMEQTPLYLGHRFKHRGNAAEVYASSEYTLNKASLKALVVKAFPECQIREGAWFDDVAIGHCFRGQQIHPYDTQNDFGEERYMLYAVRSRTILVFSI